MERLEDWLAGEFRERNTELERAYLAGSPPSGVADLVRDGGKLVDEIRAIPSDVDGQFRLLGAVGFYLAGCYRHGASPTAYAEVLATRLGLALGVAPRYVFAHQIRYGIRTFTALPADVLFLERNALGVLAYDRAATALRKIPPRELADPAAAYLLRTALHALEEVLGVNQRLAADLDVDTFYRSVRPYFTSHPVGGVTYRGVNAGDFAAISEIDLRLGVCRADDPFYQRVLAEKYPYVPPRDQPLIRAAVAATPLHADPGDELFRAVCKTHGAAYAVHHHRLVLPFIAKPAADDPSPVTASGPPLDALLATLRRLRDLRTTPPS